MAKLTARLGVTFALLAAVVAAPACAKNHPPTTAQRAKVAHGEMKASDSMTATVDAVDAPNQTVFLHDEDGRHFAVQASQRAVERLQPNDQIKVVYQESIQFALQEAKDADPNQKTKVEDLTRTSGRDAVEYGRKVSTIVQILSVGDEGEAVEFRAPEGQVRTIAIEDRDSRRKIAALRPGDKVAVTYVEKLGLALDESTAKAITGESAPRDEGNSENESEAR